MLIERLAEAISSAVLRQFPATSVRLLLRKPAALCARSVAAAAVEIERFQPKPQWQPEAESSVASKGVHTVAEEK